MHQIKANGINELFIRLARELLNKGEISFPRNQKTIELNNLWFELSNPNDNVVTLNARNINHDYLRGEMEWYKSGSLNVEDIAKHSKFWKKITNSDKTVNSNYGYFAFHQKTPDGQSQFNWCARKLLEDPQTRQAVINYNQLQHKYEENKDFVCTLNQLFRIRTIDYDISELPERHLDSTVMMRSQDMIYGLTYDLPWFTYVQEKMANQVHCHIGKYHHFAASMHVYEKHFKMLENIAAESI